MVDLEIPAEAVDEAEPASIDDEAVDDQPSARIYSVIRSNVRLFVTPAIIVVLSIILYTYVTNFLDSDSAIFQDERSLGWERNLKPQLEQHLSLTLWSTVFVIVIAVPLGILLTRPKYRRYGGPVLAVATSGQATPAFGLLILAFAWLGRGPWAVVWALTLFTILPVLRNTIVGLDQVSPSVIEAGRGMGLTNRQVLNQIEIPLAVPVILAGVRTALIINVGMATLAFLIGGGGLGVTISSGLKLGRDIVIITGAGMTAIVALSVDWIASIVERALRPRGL